MGIKSMVQYKIFNTIELTRSRKKYNLKCRKTLMVDKMSKRCQEVPL